MVTSVGVRAAVRAAVIAYGAGVSLPALALGLGEIEMQSFLNEPLRAEVALLDTRELTVDDIRIRLAGVDDFDRLGVERSYFLTSIEFDIEIDESSGTGVIRLSTDEAVLEPFIDVIIEARWPSGRLLREYTVLVDPPAFRQDVVSVSAAERISSAANLEKPAVAQTEAQSDRQQSSQAQSRQGDEVALRESSLPPGEMPDRAFSAETAQQPRSGNRYMVRRDETLWQIASRGKPEGISVQQAMLDIQRVNPEAFINGNINQIKAGYIIYLPAAGEVNSDDLALALEEVREQNQQWREGRAAPGVTAAATLRVSADTSTGAPSARDDGPRPGGSSSSASTAADTATDDAAMASAADATGDDEAPAGTSAASAELAAQLEAMSTRLDTLEQIVSLKDQQIATLEQALREAREAAAAAPTPAVVVPAPGSPAATTPAPTSPTTPPASSGGSGIPWLPIGGGLLVVLAGVFLFLRRRNQDEEPGMAAVGRDESSSDEDDVFEGVRLKKEDFPTEPEETVDSGDAIAAPTPKEVEEAADEALAGAAAASGLDALSRGGSRGYGERKHDDYIDEGAGGDALAEADIYIAYGRYLQAIELLETAISNDPQNGAYRVKLIELYVDMGEDAKAAEQLDELRATGDSEAVARGEALLGGAAAGGAASDALDLANDTPQSDDLAWNDAPDHPAASGVTDNFADSEIEAGLPELELDEDPLPEMEPQYDVAPEPDREPVVAETASAMDEVESLELSLEDAADTEMPPPAPELDDGEGEHIDFAHLEIEEDSVAELPEDELDFASDEEELDLSEALDSESESAAAAAHGDDDEDLLYADDADQMATKLDLARAYMDMGDSEGAKGILEEVRAKGTDEQQQEADDLLTRIS